MVPENPCREREQALVVVVGEEGGEVVAVDGGLDVVAGFRSQGIHVEQGGPVAAAALQLVDVVDAAQVELLEMAVDAASGPAKDRAVEVRPRRDETESRVAELVETSGERVAVVAFDRGDGARHVGQQKEVLDLGHRQYVDVA